MSNPSLARVTRSINTHIWFGVLFMLVLIGGIGGWAMFSAIEGAVISPGTVSVRSHKKQVQHLDGGVIKEIKVRDGTHVEQNDVLVRLDETQTLAELGVLKNRGLGLRIRRLRLLGERDGADVLIVPDELIAETEKNPDVGAILSVQRKLFKNRFDMRDGRRAQMQERVNQLEEEITGLRALKSGKETELELLRGELTDLDRLKEQRLVSISRYNAHKRAIADSEGQFGQVSADIARARGRIAELKLQIIELNEKFRDEALDELQRVEAELAELRDKHDATNDRLRKLVIRAPQAGIVHELAVHTVGGVIGPGERLLYIIPQSDELVVDAMVSPQDIDQIKTGFRVRVRFTSFNQRTTPEVKGRVIHVAADQSGGDGDVPLHFKVRVQIIDGEASRLGSKSIVPGMPAEVMITSASRTVLSYLTKPLTDQFNRAFRD